NRGLKPAATPKCEAVRLEGDPALPTELRPFGIVGATTWAAHTGFLLLLLSQSKSTPSPAGAGSPRLASAPRKGNQLCAPMQRLRTARAAAPLPRSPSAALRPQTETLHPLRYRMSPTNLTPPGKACRCCQRTTRVSLRDSARRG